MEAMVMAALDALAQTWPMMVTMAAMVFAVVAALVVSTTLYNRRQAANEEEARNKYEGHIAWCKVVDDDHTYRGNTPCNHKEFEEYLARWRDANGLHVNLYASEMIEKGITHHPVYLRHH